MSQAQSLWPRLFARMAGALLFVRLGNRQCSWQVLHALVALSGSWIFDDKLSEVWRGNASSDYRFAWRCSLQATAIACVGGTIVTWLRHFALSDFCVCQQRLPQWSASGVIRRPRIVVQLLNGPAMMQWSASAAVATMCHRGLHYVLGPTTLALDAMAVRVCAVSQSNSR